MTVQNMFYHCSHCSNISSLENQKKLPSPKHTLIKYFLLWLTIYQLTKHEVTVCVKGFLMKMHTETDHLKTTCSCKCSTLSIKFTSEQLKSTCKHTLDSKMVTSIPNAISCRAAVRPAIPAPIIITLPCFLAAKKKKTTAYLLNSSS